MQEYPILLKLLSNFSELCQGLEHDFPFLGDEVEFDEGNPEEQELLLFLHIFYIQIVVSDNFLPSFIIWISLNLLFALAQLDQVLWRIFSFHFIQHILIL